MAAGEEAESSHPELEAGSRERELGVEEDYKQPEPTPIVSIS